MQKYDVTGMSCAACQARVEKAVSKVDGVTSCSVSLLTNSMGVEGTANSEAIIKAVKDAGYGAKLQGPSSESKPLEDNETKTLIKRLIFSAFFLIVLMYITMGHNMLGFPLPGFFENNHVALAIVQLLLAIIVMVINGKFFKNGFGSLLHGSPNMDTLVALGSSVSFGWSLFVLFKMTGNPSDIMELYHKQLYFESAAMIPALITVGKTLESFSKGKTTNALKELMNLAPKTARVIRDGKEAEVKTEEVRVGDIFVVKPGDSIPVDGVVIEGSSAIDESSLTGESVPVDKEVDDSVSAATINTSGYLKCRATHVGEDTTLSQIIKMVSDAAATKAPIARIADKVSGIFVPVVIGIALLVIAIWLIVGREVSFALARGISVLVISCPCALGLATPVAIMVGNGLGAKNGILFKTSEALENLGKTKIIALDKTGTITSGQPQVTDICPNEISEEELLSRAFSLEKKSEHPLAGAIVRKAEGKSFSEVTDFKAIAGNGLEGRIDGKIVRGGNIRFIGKFVKVPGVFEEKEKELSDQGKTLMYFSEDDRFLGVIAVADAIKEDSSEGIKQLKDLGYKVVMLTGDNERTAKAIGKIAGVDDVVSDVLPDGKEKVIRKLQDYGKTVMVGDGINDAPALTRADIGIAIGAGTDVAIESADIVLVNNSIKDVAAAVRLSRKTLKNIHENLFWAFFYNLICIPLAAGAFVWEMNPMIGAAAMSISSFTVCMNALRLNLFKMHDASHDRPMKDQINEKIIIEQERKDDMEKTLKVEGMMCEHCEAMVKKTLEALDFISYAQPNHNDNEVKIKVEGELDEAKIKEVIEDRGYNYLGIK